MSESLESEEEKETYEQNLQVYANWLSRRAKSEKDKRREECEFHTESEHDRVSNGVTDGDKYKETIDRETVRH